MIKSKKIFYSILSLVLIVILSTVIYFVQKKYYEKKALENTRFITSLKSGKPFENININTSLYQILNDTLENTSWIQSYISGDKYVISCSGKRGNHTIKVYIYVHDMGEGKVPKTIGKLNNYVNIFQDKKKLDTYTSLSILLVNYYEQKGLKMPEKLKDMKEAINTISVMAPGYDKTNIDYDVIMDTAKALDNKQALMNGETSDSSEHNKSDDSSQSSSNSNINTIPNVGITGDLAYSILVNDSAENKENVVKSSKLQGSSISIGDAFNNYFDNVAFKYSNEYTNNLDYLVDVQATKKGSTYDMEITVSYKYNKVYIGDCTKDWQNIEPQTMINTIYSK